jgi:hypothetical protein
LTGEVDVTSVAVPTGVPLFPPVKSMKLPLKCHALISEGALSTWTYIVDWMATADRAVDQMRTSSSFPRHVSSGAFPRAMRSGPVVVSKGPVFAMAPIWTPSRKTRIIEPS